MELERKVAVCGRVIWLNEMSIGMFEVFFVFQAEDGIRDLVRSRGLGDVYKRQVYNRLGFDADEMADRYLDEVGPRLRPHIADAVSLVHESLERGEHVLFEGAQATFLDIDPVSYTHLTLPTTNPV